MQIILSAVDDSEEGIFGDTLSRFSLFPRESLRKRRARIGYIISLFLQLRHFFCLQCCRDLSMQLWTLPVSSLEY